MLVANLLALHLNLPLTDLEGLLSGRMISAGGRIDAVALQNLLSTKRRILVVDDSVLGGTSWASLRLVSQLQTCLTIFNLQPRTSFPANVIA